MKLSVLTILAITAVVSLSLGGCSSGEDGPSFSDQDLLNRAKAGREQGMQGSKTTSPPTSTTGK